MIDNKMMKKFPWKAVAVPSADLLHLKNDLNHYVIFSENYPSLSLGAVHDFAKIRNQREYYF